MMQGNTHIPLNAAKGVAVSGVAVDSQRLVKCNMACIRGKPIELVGQNTANHHKESIVNSHNHQNRHNLRQYLDMSDLVLLPVIPWLVFA